MEDTGECLEESAVYQEVMGMIGTFPFHVSVNGVRVNNTVIQLDNDWTAR